ncbi:MULTISPECIES: hypothetical protein [unclassified Thioalkalivibrio]|uniref:hypothetical protein n=1 Tax=unclassified Thioalkalivibrio TaxID=2621013 RepID=UPI00037CFA27|nr:MULTISPECIES: hypothetical protein [unclassified Thioalkalivibrio]
MDESFKKYRRKTIVDVRPYIEGEDLAGKVSISREDELNGSPRPGDVIARNPDNAAQWLINAAEFQEKFEPCPDDQPQRLPAGWQVAPMEPDPKMTSAATGIPENMAQWPVHRQDGEWQDFVRAYRCALAAVPNPPAQHPDDAAVDRFATAMKEKLAGAREKGRGGWDDPEQCSGEMLARMLFEHLGKGNPGNFQDIANLAMMLHQRGESPELLTKAVPEGYVVVPALDNDESMAIVRFVQTTQDDGTYDIGQAMIHRLADKGAIRHLSAGRYQLTQAGKAMLAVEPITTG